MDTLRVGVLMGGKSIEREVSFNSGRTVCDHLDTNRYEIVPLFQTHEGELYILSWQFLYRGKISDFEHRLPTHARNISWDALKAEIDFLYPAVHGQFAEDGTLQGLLEILGIPYLGSGVYASALGMDKIMQKEILQLHAIAVPRFVSVDPHQIEHFDTHSQEILAQMKEKDISFPCIVKPYKEGSSLGVSVAHNHAELDAALQTATSINAHKKQMVLIEEKIEGMEFTCIILFDHAKNAWMPLPPTEVAYQPNTHFFDYEQKYMPGKALEFTPARCSSEALAAIQAACIQTANALEFSTIARIDGFLKHDGTIVIVDPNSFTGMAPASFLFREAALANLNHPQVINHLIESELHQYGIAHQFNPTNQKNLSMNTPKLKIAVLLGGASNEKEISLESGRNVVYKLSDQLYDVLPVFVSSNLQLYTLTQEILVRSSTSEIEALITPEMNILWADLPRLADFVFIGLHGGIGENGCVQGTLEMLGLPYNGSGVLTSAVCMDKYKTNTFLKQKGFDVPQSMLISRAHWNQQSQEIKNTIIEKLGMPIISKPHDDGCSFLVQKINSTDDLDQALSSHFTHKEYALIEECIKGMELTVGVIGNHEARALTPSQAVAGKDILSIQEKFLPGAGENQTPAPLPAEILQRVQDTIQRAYQALNCKGYARIDCFYQPAELSPHAQDRIIILEVNTLPALTPATVIFHQAAEEGIKPREFINMIIEYGLQEHSQTIPQEKPEQLFL